MRQGNFFRLFYVLIIGTALLQMGAILRKDSAEAIRKTQTDPILYEEKKEEIKDGEKGAPVPSFKFYGERALHDPPFEEDIPDTGGDDYRLPKLGDTLPEDLTPDSKLEEDEWAWGEEMLEDDSDGLSDDEAWWASQEQNENLFKDYAEMDEFGK